MEKIKNLKINLEQKILESENVVIVPHYGVDFDAIGSAIGLAFIARKMQKPSSIIIDDHLSKIDPGVQIIIESAKKDFTIINHEKYLPTKDDGDLFILTDVNKRHLISLENELTNPEKIIIIDHHNSDEDSIKANDVYINTDVSSASEVVAKLLFLYKLKPTPEIANYLLAGIYLDTNKLTQNTSAETMRAVAKLLENGASMNRVTDYFTEDFVSDRRVQELVSRAKIYNYSIAMVCAKSDIEYTKEELAKVADYLLKYKVDAAFAIGNIGNGTVSISARSKEKVDVGSIMQKLNGGGNQHSGATKLTDCTIEEAEKNLTKMLRPPCYL